MHSYLLQATYSNQAWESLVGNPHNRLDAVRSTIQDLGGSISLSWMSFGEFNLVAILEMPDNASAIAFEYACLAKNTLRAIQITPLLAMEEGVQAMQKAKAVGYDSPQKYK